MFGFGQQPRYAAVTLFAHLDDVPIAQVAGWEPRNRIFQVYGPAKSLGWVYVHPPGWGLTAAPCRWGKAMREREHSCAFWKHDRPVPFHTTHNSYDALPGNITAIPTGKNLAQSVQLTSLFEIRWRNDIEIADMDFQHVKSSVCS